MLSWSAFGLPTRTPVLTYHDFVAKRDASSLWFDCSVREFEQQLAFLERNQAVFISVPQLEAGLRGRRKLPKKAVCLTFADNYQGFYDYAWPILKRKKIPVALFVHSGYVGNHSGRPKMTWAELRELDKSGLVEVCSQTITHPADLTVLSDSEVIREFIGSKKKLELEIGKTVRYLAYPNGKFNRRVADLARKCGYLLGFTESCEPAESMRDYWRVPRYVHTKLGLAWKSKTD